MSYRPGPPLHSDAETAAELAPARERTTALMPRRIALRSFTGFVSRGSQGALLVLAILFVSADQASDLTLAISLMTVLNLVSNAGIPTLFVRYGRTGGSDDLLLAMVRAYGVFTLLAAVLASAAIGTLTDDLLLTAGASLLLVCQSIQTGLEYWTLGQGAQEYDRFLWRCSMPQSLLALLCPATMILTHSVDLSLAALIGSFLPSIAMQVASHRAALVSLCRSTSLLSSEWRIPASIVASSTVGAAIFYGFDVIVLYFTAPDTTVAAYKLAVTCIAFVVGTVPLGILVLADSASGVRIQFKRLALLLIAATLVCLVGSLAAHSGPAALEMTSAALLVVSPLVALRLLTQVLSSRLHGQGRHADASIGYALGVVGWLAVLCVMLRVGSSVTSMGISQILLEAFVLIFFLVRSGQRTSALP